MARTAPRSRPPATHGSVRGPGRRSGSVATLVAGTCLSVLVALLGWFLGAAALTGVEPGGGFVNCGPALFGRPDPLPHPTCASAYFPLPTANVAFIVAGIIGAIVCLALLARQTSRSRRPASHMSQEGARQPAKRASLARLLIACCLPAGCLVEEDFPNRTLRAV